MASEELTTEQHDALDRLVRAFGIQHSQEFTVRLKVKDGNWIEAEVNPQRRILRRCLTRRRT